LMQHSLFYHLLQSDMVHRGMVIADGTNSHNRTQSRNL
jgi:hypothetical protein